MNKPFIVKYPWNTWFSKSRFTIKQGVHYHCMPHSMAVQIRKVASSRRLRVSVSIHDDGTIVTLVERKPRGKK